MRNLFMVYKSKMNKEQLAGFLAEARKRCSYETIGEGGETTLANGTKVIGPYKNGRLEYTDKYNGFETFRGVEEISFNKKVIWRRRYVGFISDQKHKERTEAERLYAVLKEALRKFPIDEPFRRGPKSFKHGEYEYTDSCEGDIARFRGVEEITSNGREVYLLSYSGGLIQS